MACVRTVLPRLSISTWSVSFGVKYHWKKNLLPVVINIVLFYVCVIILYYIVLYIYYTKVELPSS